MSGNPVMRSATGSDGMTPAAQRVVSMLRACARGTCGSAASKKAAASRSAAQEGGDRGAEAEAEAGGGACAFAAGRAQLAYPARLRPPRGRPRRHDRATGATRPRERRRRRA